MRDSIFLKKEVSADIVESIELKICWLSANKCNTTKLAGEEKLTQDKK